MFVVFEAPRLKVVLRGHKYGPKAEVIQKVQCFLVLLIDFCEPPVQRGCQKLLCCCHASSLLCAGVSPGGIFWAACRKVFLQETVSAWMRS